MIKNNGLYLEAWERFSAYKQLKNKKHEKYGNVLKHLYEQKGIGIYQHFKHLSNCA